MPQELPALEHLEELRKRIFACLIAVFLGTCVCLPLANRILGVLKASAGGLIPQLAYFSPEEPFILYMKISVWAGAVLVLPFILYQVFAFVGPAISKSSYKYSVFFIFAASLAFLLGCSFGYFILIPKTLRFLLSIGSTELVPVISANKFLTFYLMLIFGCGLVFQMPIISFVLSKLGIINAKFLRKYYKHAVLGIFIVSGVITPTTDAFTMCVMALPMVLLYEVSIWVSYIAARKPAGNNGYT